MPLITDSTEKVFDITSVHKGDLIRAKYSGWDEPRNGIVTAVSEDKLTVLFLPGLGNVTNYFVILAAEVEAGKELTDLADVAIANIADGDAIVYDLATTKYINKAISLDDLADVAIANPADAETLTYVAADTAWKNL
jgi:hypothetical protein